MNKKIIIGSRGSKLALIYAEIAKEKIVQNSNLNSDDIFIKEIKTQGDEVQDTRLTEIGGKGLFSKKIETELITFSDDMDGLRKVPENIPNDKILHANLGKPLTEIPDPFKKFKSFVQQAINSFKNDTNSFDKDWKEFGKIMKKKNISRKECLLLPLNTTLNALNNKSI